MVRGFFWSKYSELWLTQDNPGYIRQHGTLFKENMTQSSIWWLLAGGAVAIELMTGTFYLLMIALGLAAAALATHAGAGSATQIIVAALVGGGSVLVWRAIKSKQPASLAASVNADVNLDIGGTVQVDAWQGDGTATVNYRGAKWSVAHRNPQATATHSAGAHRIVEVIGSRFIVEKI
jgi:membrane protein implicated in regulation of membrane protease activity